MYNDYEDKKINIALLIDGENAPYKHISHILETLKLEGRPTIRRVYGDWTNNDMNKWKAVVNQYAIKPIQKFSYTHGKNSTDGALIIDAMDILHRETVKGFCIVSSDSDYTGLAKRIREEGYKMMGMGGKQTPGVFIEACDKFYYFKELNISSEEPVSKQRIRFKTSVDYVQIIDKAYQILLKEGNDEWVLLNMLGHKIMNIAPKFNSKKYGFSTLSDMFEKLKKYEIQKNGNTQQPKVRLVKNTY